MSSQVQVASEVTTQPTVMVMENIVVIQPYFKAIASNSGCTNQHFSKKRKEDEGAGEGEREGDKGDEEELQNLNNGTQMCFVLE